MPNFPASLDSLANPTATTQRNDPGFELHTVISTLNDIAELLEAKLGTSEASPQNTPLANTVLASSTNGLSKWRRIKAADIDTTAPLLARGSVVGSGSVASSTPAYTFIPDMALPGIVTTGGDLICVATVCCSQSVSTASVWIGFRLDSGTTGVGEVQHNFQHIGQPVTIAATYRFTGVTAGTHEIDVYWQPSGGTVTSAGGRRVLTVWEVK